MPQLTETMVLTMRDWFLDATITSASGTGAQNVAYARHDSGWQPADFDSANGARSVVIDLGRARKLDCVACVGLKVTGTTIVDYYAAANQDSTQALGNGSIVAVGQEFNVASDDGGTLVSCRFDLSKTGTPTGNATAYLYESDGSSPAVPTGDALATSGTLDVSTLTGSLAMTTLSFTDSFYMDPSTDYFIVLGYSGGDGSNYVNVGTDTSSPSHGGNFATSTGTWTGVAGTDAVFDVTRNIGPLDVTWKVEGADDTAFAGGDLSDWGSQAYVVRASGAASARFDMPQPNLGPEDWQLPGIMNANRLHSLHIRDEGSEVEKRFWRVSFTNGAASSSDNTLYVPKLFGAWGRLTVNYQTLATTVLRLDSGEVLRRWSIQFGTVAEDELEQKWLPALAVGKRVFMALDPEDRPEYFLPAGTSGGGSAAMVEVVGHSISRQSHGVKLFAAPNLDGFMYDVSLDLAERFNGETES